jgi:putative lipoic acid-binding regulatory protein
LIQAKESSFMLLCYKLSLLLTVLGLSEAFGPSYRYRRTFLLKMASEDKPTGSFFNEVPDDSGPDGAKDIDASLDDLLKARKKPAKASQPSTIEGVPTSEAKGFAKPGATSSKKPYIGVGPPDKPLNEPQNPEYDDQGYMLYADEETGEKKRVFEALVEYPSVFTMKIVGANVGTFVEDMVQVVADSCDKDVADIAYSTKEMGKWVSVTVEAPVENAEMLYALYENVDRDPRVKFKF